jgi:hypothetical protein
MPNPWESLRCDQLIRVNKAANEKEQWEKGWRGRKEKTFKKYFKVTPKTLVVVKPKIIPEKEDGRRALTGIHLAAAAVKTCPKQGCQMACFQTNLGKFWRVLQWKMLVCFMVIWSIYSHLVYFGATWYYLWLFGVFFAVLVCCA